MEAPRVLPPVLDSVHQAVLKQCRARGPKPQLPIAPRWRFEVFAARLAQPFSSRLSLPRWSEVIGSKGLVDFESRSVDV